MSKVKRNKLLLNLFVTFVYSFYIFVFPLIPVVYADDSVVVSDPSTSFTEPEDTLTNPPDPGASGASDPSDDDKSDPKDEPVNQEDSNIEAVISQAEEEVSEIEELSPDPDDSPIIMEASTSSDLNADANTGSNESDTDDGEIMMVTGDAVADGNLVQESNILTTSDDSDESNDATESSSLQDEPTDPNLALMLADTDLNAVVTANTGNNYASAPLVIIDTEDAYAVGNFVNIANLLLNNSNLHYTQVLVDDSYGQYNVDIYSLLGLDQPFETQSSSDGCSLEPVCNGSLLLVQHASVSAEMYVGANTGNNLIVAGAAGLMTGDANAAGTYLGFSNTVMNNSQIYFSVVDIIGEFGGNLILPRWDYFISSNDAFNGFVPIIYGNINNAEVDSQSISSANTGFNTKNSPGVMLTGDANSFATKMMMVNSSMDNGEVYIILLQNDQMWTGMTDTAFSGNKALPVSTKAYDEQTMSDAKVDTSLVVEANTGNNLIDAAYSEMVTGTATAIANTFEFINTTFNNSKIFIQVVNLLNQWNGDIEYAFPDMQVSIDSSHYNFTYGDNVVLHVKASNHGYDLSKSTIVNLQLPAGLSFVSSSLGGYSLNGNHVRWSIGNVGVGETIDIDVVVRVNDDFNFADASTLWDKIIPKAYASDGMMEKRVSIEASVATSDPELNTGNNTFTFRPIVYMNTGTGGSGFVDDDNRQPKLHISLVNNVNEYVYPGDIVTFTAEIMNDSDVAAHDAVAYQQLFDEYGNLLAVTPFDLGTIDSMATGRLEFGLTIPEFISSSSQFFTQIYIEASAPDGSYVESNIATSEFWVQVNDSYLNGNMASIREEDYEWKSNPADVTLVQPVLGASTEDLNNSIGVYRWYYLPLLFASLLMLRVGIRVVFKK